VAAARPEAPEYWRWVGRSEGRRARSRAARPAGGADVVSGAVAVIVTANFREFVRLTRDRGALRFPLVRPSDGGFEIVSGHRRTEAARRAGLDAIPVRVAEMTDWEATTIFLDEHVPTERAELNDSVMDHTPWYKPVHLDALVEELQEDWPEDRLREHPALRWYLDNAYLGSGDDGDAETDASGANDADEDSGDTDADDAVGAEGGAEEPDGDESEVASASGG